MQNGNDIDISELHSEVHKLNQILKSTAVPTFAIDINSRVTHWNSACEMLTGIPAAEMIGTNRHQEVFYEYRRPLMVDLLVRNVSFTELNLYYGGFIKASHLVAGGYEGEDFFHRIGHGGRWLFFTAAPLKDASGEVIGAVETLQDVSQRRLAEQQLRSSEAKYRQLFETANDAIFLLENGNAIDCNQKGIDLFQCRREDIIGATPTDFSPEFQPTGLRSADEMARLGEMATDMAPNFFEWRFRKKDGADFDAEVSLTSFKVSESTFQISIVRDITEKKRLISELQKHEKELNEKSGYLEKVNQALKASLDHREIEKRAVEENMLVRIKQFILPYLEKLARCGIDADARAYLKIVDTNMNDLLSQFAHTIFSRYSDLTPTEIRIANFIREGHDTKDIARMMGLSPSSIQWHRKNIRSKLGLTNKKINLYNYLNSHPQ